MSRCRWQGLGIGPISAILLLTQLELRVQATKGNIVTSPPPVCLPSPGNVVYRAVRSYTSQQPDEVSVPIGSAVRVLRMSQDGWWLIR